MDQNIQNEMATTISFEAFGSRDTYLVEVPNTVLIQGI